MKLLLVTYQQKSFWKDYSNFYEALKSSEHWWHHIDNTWILCTNHPKEKWNDHLRQFLNEDDFLLIVDITKSEYSGWLPKEAWEWISTHKRIAR